MIEAGSRVNIAGVAPQLDDTDKIAVTTYAYDGSVWNPVTCNRNITVLASGNRSSTTASADQTNCGAVGVIIWFDVTAVPGGDTVQLQLQGKDPVSEKYVTILQSGTVNSVSIVQLVVYPGVTDTASQYDAENDSPLPRTWRVNVVHSGSGTFTYSVGASYVR